jgi:hypothetical protein
MGDRSMSDMDYQGDQPLLGLATTRQLLEEIEARGECECFYEQEGSDMAIGAANLLDSLPGSMLNYRTVDEPADALAFHPELPQTRRRLDMTETREDGIPVIADERDHMQSALHMMRDAFIEACQSGVPWGKAGELQRQFFDGYQAAKRVWGDALVKRDVLGKEQPELDQQGRVS